MGLPFDQVVRQERFIQDHPEWSIHPQDGATRFIAEKGDTGGLPRRGRHVAAGTAEPARRDRGGPVTGWTLPDRDILRRVIFQLQYPDWQVRAPPTARTGMARQ